MAVYTHLSETQIRDHLTVHYTLGAFHAAKGIAEGVENTNYLLTLRTGDTDTRYILTLFEKRVATADLPFFMALMAHLSEHRIPCPLPIAKRDGGYLATLAGKPASLVSFLAGHSVHPITDAHTHAVGQLAANLHLAARNFSGMRSNALSLHGWQELFARIAPRIDTLKPGMANLVAHELAYLQHAWPTTLPAGIVHADLFPDNVFFSDHAISGVIDFYFACHDFWAYDLAIAMNAWCFDATHRFDLTKARALLAAYQAIRPLEAREAEAFPILARGAALRFFLTRAHDLLFPQEGALVTAKDPMEYLAKLQHHQSITSANAYGLL